MLTSWLLVVICALFSVFCNFSALAAEELRAGEQKVVVNEEGDGQQEDGQSNDSQEGQKNPASENVKQSSELDDDLIIDGQNTLDETAKPSVLQQARAAVSNERWVEAERLLLLALATELSDEDRAFVEQSLQFLSEQREQQPKDELQHLREILQEVLSGTEPTVTHWQAYADFQRLAPQDPMLESVTLALGPKWAASHGQDEFGTWATLRIGRTLLRLRYIPAGVLDIGYSQLQVDQPFWIGQHEFSVGLWTNIMGDNTREADQQLPKVDVSPKHIEGLLGRLNQNMVDRNIAMQLRLPTPSEWEYAARAGVTSDLPPWLRTAADAVIDRLKRHPVGYSQPNTYGLRDVQGNVWEILFDPLAQRYQRRGGGWRSRLSHCAFGLAYSLEPEVHSVTTGFRIVMIERDDHVAPTPPQPVEVVQ